MEDVNGQEAGTSKAEKAVRIRSPNAEHFKQVLQKYREGMTQNTCNSAPDDRLGGKSDAIQVDGKNEGEENTTTDFSQDAPGMQRPGVSTEDDQELVKGCNSLMVDPSSLADEAKEWANKEFAQHRYSEAIDLYSEAINLDPEVAAYYANRSIAYVRMEAFGYALGDANAAITLDKRYIKAYYRRAAAYMGMGKYKAALKDLEFVRQHSPQSKETRKQYETCEKIVKRGAFMKAIASEDDKAHQVNVDVDSIDVDESYTGPRLTEDGEVSESFMQDLLPWFRDRKLLHRKYAFQIIQKIRSYFQEQPTVVDVDIGKNKKFTVCGDIHGQFYDLLNIFKINDVPSQSNPYLFNGDFVDRGSFSVEVILTLFGYKLLYPEHMFLSRGNHESENMNQMYGFEGEVKSKYNSTMVDLFTQTFNYLPLAHVLSHKVMVMHGGLFREDGVTLDDIRNIQRNRQPPEEGLMCDLLWSDPQPMAGRSPSKRGVGIQFGPDITQRFLNQNKLEYIIRSHEVKNEGYEICHSGNCVTVFSAPNYCDKMGNKGAFVVLRMCNNGKVFRNFSSFNAAPHPDVKPMAYAENSILKMLM